MTNLACAVLKNHEIENLIGKVLYLGGNLLGEGFSCNAVIFMFAIIGC
jgi:inosine-uridine nucleoside N-ribohydrolase